MYGSIEVSIASRLQVPPRALKQRWAHQCLTGMSILNRLLRLGVCFYSPAVAKALARLHTRTVLQCMNIRRGVCTQAFCRVHDRREGRYSLQVVHAETSICIVYTSVHHARPPSSCQCLKPLKPSSADRLLNTLARECGPPDTPNTSRITVHTPNT